MTLEEKRTVRERGGATDQPYRQSTDFVCEEP